MEKIKILGICGSLRKDSYNRKALKIALKFAEESGAEVAEADLKELNIPIYDGDIESAGLPESVLNLKAAVESSSVLLIASPEYNYSVSGALKNTIDWLSRGNNSLDNKVAAIFGVSGGNFGTVRGQFHLRQILDALNVFILPQPQVLVRLGAEAFNDDGFFKDEKTAAILKDLVQKTIELAIKIGR